MREEKWINGLLYWRASKQEEWMLVQLVGMNRRLREAYDKIEVLESEIRDLHEDRVTLYEKK